MRATGHNVTSVLMNPRETLLEDLMDDFASEQSTVLEALHPRQPITAEVVHRLSLTTWICVAYVYYRIQVEECRRIVVKLRALIGKRNKTLSNTMVPHARENLLALIFSTLSSAFPSGDPRSDERRR